MAKTKLISTGDKQNLTKNWDVVGIKLITSAASLLHCVTSNSWWNSSCSLRISSRASKKRGHQRSPAFLKGTSTGNMRKPWCFSPNLGGVLWMFPSSHFLGDGNQSWPMEWRGIIIHLRRIQREYRFDIASPRKYLEILSNMDKYGRIWQNMAECTVPYKVVLFVGVIQMCPTQSRLSAFLFCFLENCARTSRGRVHMWVRISTTPGNGRLTLW